MVSNYLRTSPRKPPTNSIKRRPIPTTHLANFHDTRAPREEQEDSDSDIEVFGPFPSEKNTSSTPTGGAVKVVKDSGLKPTKSYEILPLYHSYHPQTSRLHTFFLQKAMEDVSISPKKPRAAGTSSRAPSWTSTSKIQKPVRASKIASVATTSLKQARKPAKVSEPAEDLPVYSYNDCIDPRPCVVYTRDVGEADDLVAGLRPGPVAFDMEWCFSAWSVRRTAVVQVADSAGLVIIVHLSEMPHFPKSLQRLIEDPNTPKLGANIMNDGKKLFRDYGILAKSLLELGVLAAAWDPAHAIKRKVISLAKLAAIYTGKTLAKGDERTSNWEVSELSELQKDYAANDVHCTIEIYRKLRSLAAVLPAGADVPWHELKGKQEDTPVQEMRLQWRRAHTLWHEKGMQLEKMCAEMRVRKEGVPDEGPLKIGTVMYVVVFSFRVTFGG
ncbi:hypothetical protein C0991_004730 [Blastosporella zonata]|nr:hypothetical protein C0991_004730 [Blastosporella zonata]